MKKKNIVYIYADDLGRGMLSAYGQEKFNTPSLDRLAREGMRFTTATATAFCAPARASLICGIHDAHAGRWTYTPGAYYKKISTGELSYDEVQEVLQHVGIEGNCGGEYIATVAKKAGYKTAEIGKLEWGFSTTPKEVFSHGWDYHYGYYDHIRCHGYYPPFLFENGEMVMLEGNTDPHCGRRRYGDINDVDDCDMSFRKIYSQDVFDEKILQFIRENKDENFFLFHPSQLPHARTFYPDIYPQVRDREDLTQAEKEYASMVLRLDETVGKVLDELEILGIRENTIVIFASDNGHTPGYQNEGRCMKNHQLDGTPTNDLNNPFRTSTCGDVFNGNDSMAGLKFSNWNGGCVIPFIASCPSLIEENTTCDTLISNYDTLATICDIVGKEKPKQTDGISYYPLLTGEDNGEIHEYVIYACKNGPAIMTQDGWKLRSYFDPNAISAAGTSYLSIDDRITFQLYNWKEDFREEKDVAKEYPELVAKLKHKLVCECDGNLLNGTPDAHLAHPDYPVPKFKEITKNVI